MDSKLAAKLNASVAVILGCVLSLQKLTPTSCPGLTSPVLPLLSISAPSPGEKHIVFYESSAPGEDGSAHQMQCVCFLGLPQAALLGSNAILLPPLDFPHVIRRVLGKEGMEMTG